MLKFHYNTTSSFHYTNLTPISLLTLKIQCAKYATTETIASHSSMRHHHHTFVNQKHDSDPKPEEGYALNLLFKFNHKFDTINLDVKLKLRYRNKHEANEASVPEAFSLPFLVSFGLRSHAVRTLSLRLQEGIQDWYS